MEDGYVLTKHQINWHFVRLILRWKQKITTLN